MIRSTWINDPAQESGYGGIEEAFIPAKAVEQEPVMVGLGLVLKQPSWFNNYRSLSIASINSWGLICSVCPVRVKLSLVAKLLHILWLLM